MSERGIVPGIKLDYRNRCNLRAAIEGFVVRWLRHSYREVNMRWLLVLAGSFWAVSAPAAECLTVSDNNLEEIRNEYGMATVEWSAEVSNSCDASYDGTLTVQLLDSDGEALHEALEIIILQNNASERTTKRITLPVESYEAVADISVDIRERERPD